MACGYCIGPGISVGVHITMSPPTWTPSSDCNKKTIETKVLDGKTMALIGFTILDYTLSNYGRVEKVEMVIPCD